MFSFPLQLLTPELLSSERGLFVYNATARTFWFNTALTPEEIKEKAKYYWLTGVLASMAVYNDMIMPLAFPLVVRLLATLSHSSLLSGPSGRPPSVALRTKEQGGHVPLSDAHSHREKTWWSMRFRWAHFHFHSALELMLYVCLERGDVFWLCWLAFFVESEKYGSSRMAETSLCVLGA